MKVIIIISDDFDFSTKLVVDQLIDLNAKYIIINKFSKIRISYINIIEKDFCFNVENEDNTYIVSKKDIKCIWHRKGYLVAPYNIYNGNADFEKSITDFNILETKSALQILNKLFKRYCKTINNFEDIFLDKVEVLTSALEIGLAIPNTIIVDNKKDLIRFKNNNEIINKAISSVIEVAYENSNYLTYTELVDDYMMSAYPDDFLPSLFQYKIDKKYEIRTFYFNHIFYSMAIFSQNNKQTEIDFRKYDNHTPNRKCPYKLPSNIELKLTKLMNLYQLESGSIDLIVDKNNTYYFLEINPFGQYDMVSVPCNYNLHTIIANYLYES